MQLRIDVSVNAYNDPNVQGDLRLSETMEISAASFGEIASILGQFHAVALKLTKGEG
jgi:hypothetical protein